jgi:hypothetical protein
MLPFPKVGADETPALQGGRARSALFAVADGATAVIACRPGCGACCIAPSISTLDKPAGAACVHLADDYRCTLFGSDRRPSCCSSLQPSSEMCGGHRDEALAWLARLEADTAPC